MRKPFSMGRAPQKQEVDINLASIIDCLTVLITFTLASASFLSIGILETGASSSTNSATSNGAAPEKTPAQLTVMLKNDRSIQLSARGSFRQALQIPRSESSPPVWDFPHLTRTLESWSKAHPELRRSAATIESEASVPYRELVRAIEASRQTVAWVALGGL
ncbi:biopolymer transporter ExbD [Bdellovibrionota bacterium FG-2]